MSTGIFYVNSSHENLKYVTEAERSAKSFRRFFPGTEFTLYTDATGFSSSVFDAILPASFKIPPNLLHTNHKNGQMVAKHSILYSSKYERTMYLGSDTYALKPEVASLFSLLDQFDIVASHAPYRINISSGNTPIPEIPPSFPEFNCDIVLYRASPQVTQFLTKWRDMYLDHTFEHPHDQGAFRYLVWKSKIRIATLPPEYNYRGSKFRSDTVILQNRDKLPLYIDGEQKDPFAVRAANKLASTFNFPFRIIRA